MLDLAARPIKEVTLEPIARLIGSRFHPTQITIFGFAVGLVGIFASSLGHFNTGRLEIDHRPFIQDTDRLSYRLLGYESHLGWYRWNSCPDHKQAIRSGWLLGHCFRLYNIWPRADFSNVWCSI